MRAPGENASAGQSIPSIGLTPAVLTFINTSPQQARGLAHPRISALPDLAEYEFVPLSWAPSHPWSYPHLEIWRPLLCTNC